MAGSRKNNKRPPKGPARQGAVADAARPTRVEKSTGNRRCGSAVQGAVTQTATNQTAQTAQTTQGQVPAPARRRRGVLSADVLTHGNLFGLRDPDDIATRNRRAAAGTTTSGTRPARKATKPTKKGTGRGTVAAAAPIAQAPQPAAPQPAHQSPLNNVEPEADVQPADNEPAPADEAVPKDIAAEQEAEREASEVQGAIRQAAAAKDRAAKQRVEKEEADKKKREADEKKKAAKAKADREQAERDEAARVAREEADRKEAVEEAMRKQAAQEQAKRDEAARVVKAEADRKQAAQEQAERVEAVRVAQGEADRKQAEEAARAQAVREKAAEEKRAAEEKEAAEKKQKAAQEAACQKAAQEATKAKADKEKAAAEAKAVQEKEQAAKARAAQDDAAAKTKAAAQKKAADDVAAFKKAEEEAKVEKLHQAKDQKEREKQELLEKEARGLKRPGVKRAAPPIEDQANKKAKTDDCKPSCERFENDLLHAKFIFGNQIARTPDGPVKFGSHLNLDIIFQALASVTEAINDAYAHYEKDKPDEQARRDQQGNPNMLTQDAVDKLWGLFHPRSLVDHNIVEHPVVLPRHEALVPINRSAGRKTLLSLVVLVQTEVGSRHGRELFAMHHYDCDPSLRAAFHNTFARQTVRSQIVKSGWTASRKGEIENPLGQSENRDCCDRLPGPDQEWTTGIHAILNGLVCAFKLKHNKNALLSNEGFYEKAVDLVNLAIRGHVRSRMILDFFDCYEYVEKDDLPEDQRQRRTFTGTKDFETYPRLHKEILRLLGRKPAVDIDDIMTPRTGPTETTEKPLGSGRRTGDYPPSNLDAFFRGTDGREELPKGKADAAKPKEGSVVDDGYDSARSDNDDDDDDEHDKDDEIDDEEDEAVEAPKIRFDFRGKVMTPEAIAAEKAANAAAKEKKEREKREREEREAPAREAADRVNAVEHDDTEDNSLFEDDDEDMNEFYNNNEPSQRDRPAPTSAPRDEVAQDDPEEDLYTSSISPRRQTQPRPSLQPTAVDGEDEDLYTSSPPRNRGPPPIAPASNLHLPGAPPPTPHDPYAAQPFLFPTMYPPVPPAPPVAKQSFNLVSEKGPVLPPPVLPPTSGRNPGFSVPPLSLSPKVKSKSPPKVVTTDSRQSTNPNPHGTSRVPDTLTDSSEYHDENTRAEPNGSAQANAPQEETTQPPAPQPTEADLEEEAFEMSRRGAYRLSPGLEAAMEAYDDNEDYDDQDEDPNDYQGERLPYTGDCYLEPDAGVKVRHRKKDDVQYGDVEVEVDENAEDEDEIDFAYDDDDDVDESGLY